MKLSLAILAATATTAASKAITMASSGLRADSELGQNLLAKARRVEQEGEADMTWVSGYSLKFQGCHHIQQWNEDVDDEDDVRIMSKRLVRFRLCPSSSCSASNAMGCKSGYGDYIIDINTFMDAYFEATRRTSEYECNDYLNNNCDCEDDDGKGDDFDRDICEYECFAAAGLADTCVDRNPYEDDQNREEKFEPERYMECAQYELPEADDDGANAAQADDAAEAVQYYIGPYCSNQGGSILLGLFSDDACTEFADSNGGRSTFATISGGLELPYSKVSLIGSECVSCLDKERKDEADNADDDGKQNDGDIVLDSCEEIYQSAGKCESYLPSGTVDEPNESACNYISGITLVAENGVIVKSSKPSAVLTFFTVLFATLCGFLVYYVLLLRKKIRRQAAAKTKEQPLL